MKLHSPNVASLMNRILLALSLLLVPPVFAADYDELWRGVTSAQEEGLPQTALQRVKEITDHALMERNPPQLARALAFEVNFETAVQGGQPAERITRMVARVETAPAEVKPVLQTLLAHYYWVYYQHNRWRFMERTRTDEPPGDDFTTWDLPRLFVEIDRHFTAALSAADELKSIPIADWDALVEKGAYPDNYRPTLYDFLAHEALSFYTAGDQAGAAPQDMFELTADMPALAPVEDFLAWELPGARPDESGEGGVDVQLRALLVYQDLLRFHRNDEDPTAFLDVNLARLTFAWNTAVGDERHAQFKAALERFVSDHADHEVSAHARRYLARLVWEREDDLPAAREIALVGKNAFPDSVGGRMCHNLVEEIEEREVRILTARVWNEPWPEIEVRYSNITNVWFRAVKYEWETFLGRDQPHPENLNEAGRRELLSRTPALTWSNSLPATVDFKQHAIGLPAPETLEPGFYLIVASHDPDFSAEDNVVSYTPVWVSDLGLIVRNRAGLIEGFVLDALTGEPVSGATVRGWYLEQNRTRREVPLVLSDTNGRFVFRDPPDRRGLLIKAAKGGHEIASERDIWWGRGQETPVEEHSAIFTDRALYRPGQTIRYKGVALRSDPGRNRYETLTDGRVTVVFYDANQQEIARQDRPVNDFGSFSGGFTAPDGTLTGNMHIWVENGPLGQAWFNVEEYKRPKFRVELSKPDEAFRLDETVKLGGKATAYTGAAIDGAKLQWRVVREVRFPSWSGWHRGWDRHQPENEEIAYGTLTTGVNGAFEIEFVAEPDRSVLEADDPRFSYAVYADVTDSAGETRSSQTSVTVGYTALEVTASADDWQTSDEPVQLRIDTATLDGEPQGAEGTVKVHRLQAPDSVQRPLIGEISSYRRGAPDDRVDLSDPNNWDLGEVVLEESFATDGAGTTTNEFSLDAGVYRVVIETEDRYGKSVKALQPLRVVDPAASELAMKVPFLLSAPEWSPEPGEDFVALWGTGYETGRAYVEIEHRNQIISNYWTTPDRTQQEIRFPVEEGMRGGFTLHVTMVRENRAYTESRHVDVPWTNKEFELSWEHFTSKLEPGQQETWTLVVRPKNGEGAEPLAAELAATLYDASLDQFQRHDWMRRFDVFHRDRSTARVEFQNGTGWFQQILGNWEANYVAVDQRHRHFPDALTTNAGRGRGYMARYRTLDSASHLDFSRAAMPPGAMAEPAMAGAKMEMVAEIAGGGDLGAADRPDPDVPDVDLSQVSARRNLNETAFFFPHLTSDTNGVVRMTFTMPEALTEWRFMGFAHDRELRSGFLEATTITSKDIMVQPNPPRFVRAGDEIEFTVKVSNQSAARQTGRVSLNFADARTEASVNDQLNLRELEQSFDIPSKESRTFAWRIAVPDGLGLLTYRAAGSTGRVSDGEEGYLPVLSRRVFLTESLPLPIRGPGEKEFTFEALKNSADSDTLSHHALTVQMASNPAWYAVLALPYLMEFPHECTEQTFNRFYANALAKHIADSDPKIRRVFDQWKNTPALDSPLEKNEDLKSVLLEETPWVRQAKDESEARRNVGVLFDANRLATEQNATLEKLAQMQLEDGRWSWFPGGRANDYITLYITTGFGRLRHLGADVDVNPALRALERLDQWALEEYDRIQRHPDPDEYVPSPTICLFLYGRSFFLADRPVGAAHRAAVDFFLKQGREHWLKTGNRQSQGHLAIALKRFGDTATPGAILRSLKERSVTDEELGRFWRDTEQSWWWYRAPIETQALMIEAFDEVAGDSATVEECRVWLLKQKQTQDWKTTKATADAVYSLLLRGTDILSSDALVEVSLNGKLVAGGPSPRPSP